MDSLKVKAEDISQFGSSDILIGEDWYRYAGSAYLEDNHGWMMINFFLDGVYRAQLGKLIVPKDFMILTRSR